MPSALHYGYCDFAQYDGVGRARASLSSGTLLPSFPKCLSNPNFVILVVPAEPKLRHSPQCPLHPNFVIPRAVAESIFACQRISQRSQRPLHSSMDTATSRSMTVLVGQGRLCPLALFSRHSRSACRTGTLSFPQCPLHPNFVILVVAAESKPRHSAQCPLHPNFVIPRAVAESISACQRIRQRSQCPLHSSMDTATSRSMTVLVGQGRLCPLALFSRHSRSSCRTGTPSFPE